MEWHFKLCFMIGTLFQMMSTYVVGFCFMECGPIASGFSYNGTDKQGNVKHDRVKSVIIKGLLTSNKVKDFLASWNISVHEWLKYYVYLRLLNNKERSRTNAFAALVSFGVSAIWHGFYPGYYSFFFGCFILDLWNKLAMHVIGTSFNWVPEKLSNAFLTVFYYIPCSYFAISFVLLNFSDFHPVYMSMGYCLHFFFLSTIPILISLQPKRRTRTQEPLADPKKSDRKSVV